MDARTATSKAETTFHTGDVALMKMLTEGRLADSVWRIEEKDYSNAAARRPFISCMLHRVSLLLAQSGHSTVEFRCPLLGVKRTLPEPAPMSAFDPKRTFGPEDCCHAK